MIAKNSVYLDAAGKPVAEGDKSARSLLVRAGGELTEAQAEKYEGAAAIAGGTKQAPKEDHEVKHREPEPQHRDPKHKGK